MHIYFERLKQRLDALNQLRVERALDGMHDNFKLVYQLTPLFLHYHHPAMPGFLQHGAPHEIALFTPSEEQIELLLTQVDSLVNDPDFSQETFSKSKIDSLGSLQKPMNTSGFYSEVDDRSAVNKLTDNKLTENKIIGSQVFANSALSRSFYYQQASQSSPFQSRSQLPSDSEQNYQAPIIGIYSMGSTSFLGQNSLSDLDLWICHQSWLSEQEVEQLAHKCTLLEDWAESLGVQVSLFLVDENRFRHSQSGSLNDDDCGTSQHYLLLDEFYRSAVRLAGKRLLWYLIPSEQEEHYDEYVNLLYSHGILTPNEWLDLGAVGDLSAKEYFGSSLWQLYKSIDSPYKAVLKSLLLEAYSFSYPDTKLLAVEIKQHIHNGEIISSGLDAYVLMLRKISEYLIKNNDHKRLQLIRRCFYLKINEDYSNSITSNQFATDSAPASWRKKVLQQLVQSWGWSEHELQLLNQRQYWKIEQVRPAFDEILDAVMESYRNLIHFARRHNVSVSATPQDIGILTRKLYAAYEQLPGKVNLINPQISPNLSEEHITFLNVRLGAVNRAGWYLFNRAPIAKQMLGRRTIEYNLYLSKLIVWSYMNGLMTDDTQIHVRARIDLPENKISQFYRDIKTVFPQEFAPASPTALYSPAEIDVLAIIVNLESDPTQTLSKELLEAETGEFDSEGDDCTYKKNKEMFSSILSYGEEQLSLVGSLDFVYRNSWNELRTLHYQGANCVIEGLKALLNKMHQFASPPKIVKVFTYSQAMQQRITEEVHTLFSEAIHLRLIRSPQQTVESQNQSKTLRDFIHSSTSSRSKPIVKIINVEGIRWGLFFERLSVSAEILESGAESYSIISDYKLSIFGNKKPKTDIDETNNKTDLNVSDNKLPELIESYACEGIIQFFFQPIEQTERFNTYILDERNQVEIFRDCEGSQEDLVKDVSRFYSASHDRFTSSAQSMSFNLPQFYSLIIKDGTQIVLPFRAD